MWKLPIVKKPKVIMKERVITTNNKINRAIKTIWSLEVE